MASSRKNFVGFTSDAPIVSSRAKRAISTRPKYVSVKLYL